MTRQARSLFVVAALVVFAFTVRAHAEGETPAMKPFKHKVGRFQVSMPGTPKEQTTVENTPAGDITLWQGSVVLASRAYFISYSDMPKATWKADVKVMLDGARDGAVTRMKGKLAGDRDVKLGKWPGREFKIVTDKVESTVRVYLVDHRLYQVTMGCLVNGCRDAEVQDYMSSFKLAK